MTANLQEAIRDAIDALRVRNSISTLDKQGFITYIGQYPTDHILHPGETYYSAFSGIEQSLIQADEVDFLNYGNRQLGTEYTDIPSLMQALRDHKWVVEVGQYPADHELHPDKLHYSAILGKEEIFRGISQADAVDLIGYARAHRNPGLDTRL